jgi:hypothetical protein
MPDEAQVTASAEIDIDKPLWLREAEAPMLAESSKTPHRARGRIRSRQGPQAEWRAGPGIPECGRRRQGLSPRRRPQGWVEVLVPDLFDQPVYPHVEVLPDAPLACGQ